jgi:O-antigen/teichoic acid export membrane protein
LDFGFGVSLSRYLSQAFGKNDGGSRFRAIAGTGLAFYTASNVLVALAAVALAVWAPGILSVSADMVRQTRVALLLVGVWALVRTPLAVYGAALVAMQELAAANTALTVSIIARLGLSVAALLAGFGLVGLIVAQLVGEALAGAMQWRRFVRLAAANRPRYRYADRAAFRAMFSFSSQVMLSAVSSRLVYSTDQLIVSRLAGLAAAAVYYTTQTPSFILLQMIWRVSDNAVPALNELHARGEDKSVASSLVRITKYSLLLAFGAAGGIALFNEAVVRMWVGQKQYAGDAMTLALALFVVFATLNHILAHALVVYGRVRWLSIGGFGFGLFNIALSFYLGGRYGISGVMIASAVVELVGVIVFMPYVLRLLNLRALHLMRGALVPPLAAVSFTVPVAAAIVLSRVSGVGLPTLPMMVAYFALWLGGTWLVGLSQSERRAGRDVVISIRQSLPTGSSG